MIRTYSELTRINDYAERFHYLALRGVVAEKTFGFDRYLNQKFYTSSEWRSLRYQVIARDNGCDLAMPGYEIHGRLTIHHMNPVTKSNIIHGDEEILNPDYLISTTLTTHNAIHYGDEKLLARPLVERRPGDTKLW